jgi:TolB protein
LQTSAYAILNLELTKGVDQAIPIAVIPFKFQGNQQLPLDITGIISQDLQNSGRFKLLKDIQQSPSDIKNVDFAYWQSQGVDDLVFGKIQAYGNDKYQISFSLVDIYKHFKIKSFFDTNPILAKETYVVQAKDLRKLTHKIADIIYEKLTGERGIFSTKIAYILVDRTPNQLRKYSLIVADADGYNPQAILTSNQPTMSPAWSPDGKSIAYVSFENRRSTLFVSDVTTGKRRLVTNFPGINGAPAWSPDGKHLALVLSHNGGTKIFLVDLKNGKLSQLTNGWLIDTEPCFSPDGKSILFTSDRAGSPQIYLRNLANGTLHRLTFVGNYNARASFTPDGKNDYLCIA